jgi:alpha-L-fucosidase
LYNPELITTFSIVFIKITIAMSCRKIGLLLILTLTTLRTPAQDMKDMWTKDASLNSTHPGLKWFREAKFGLFIHWGLYSKLGGRWKDSSYYGSGEWLMNRARIPAADYARVAATFNPQDFDAHQWAQMAKDAGIRYMVVTGKHHEGFSMFNSAVTDFDIVDATPYKKDPMKDLVAACREQGIRFGFYYSQFLDWHEPDGGGNKWDFQEARKDYQRYYRQKSIPQLKELLTNYGPLDIVWFDMPGGLTKEQTKSMIDSLRRLQPGCLFSSRVGHGLGDYRDFGDSEVPPVPIAGAWESIYTHNDSWGYVTHDLNFKSAREIIHLLSNVASKGGNLMLNVGPDGTGKWPEYSVRYLAAVGKWLRQYGESIYGTTHGLIPAQPWGVTTSKPQRLYLHVWQAPANGQLRVPYIKAKVKTVKLLGSAAAVKWKQLPDETLIQLPAQLPDSRNTVLVLEYNGEQPDSAALQVQTLSNQYPQTEVPAVSAKSKGQVQNKLFTYSHYFGDWKHDNCAVNMQQPGDELVFRLLVQDAGDYKVTLDYSCPSASARQEGVVEAAGQQLPFLSLFTGEYDSHAPLMFIQHGVGILHFPKAGVYELRIRPAAANKAELFRLRKLILQPV